MDMEDDWDLNAVVRGCTTLASASSSTSTIATRSTTVASPYSAPSNCYGTNYQLVATSGFPTAFDGGQENQLFSLPDPFESRNSAEGLHEMCKPFFPKLQAFTPKAETLTCFSYPTAPTQVQQKQKQLLHTQSGTTPRSKRRKNQHKKVCQVPAEALSEDIWSWRKYGQKPIKGSPYPRGYYRCSSSKGCLARKQVERSRSDPRMFIVTYTAEHNHPVPTHKNSLAGSTRQKPATPKAAGDGDSDQKLPTKPASPVTPKIEEEGATQSTISENREEDKEDFADDEEEEDELFLRDMELTDDFFTGFDEFTSPASFTDHFPATIAVSSWITNGTAAAASTSLLPAKS